MGAPFAWEGWRASWRLRWADNTIDRGYGQTENGFFVYRKHTKNPLQLIPRWYTGRGQDGPPPAAGGDVHLPSNVGGTGQSGL